jgi:hypothetical protein
MSQPLILFGAGASFGSQKEDTPLLGASLFEALRAFNPPGWGKIPHELVEVFRIDFENGMRRLSERHPGWMPILQRAMAAYFFRFTPSEDSLYLRLAHRMRRSKWTGGIATLNYERLMELSLLHVGIQPEVGGPPHKENAVEMCLPHGCCHLFCQSVRGSSAGVILGGTGITTSGPIKVISDSGEFRQRIESDAFPPVMSYFEPKKQTTSGINFITAQRARWRELASQASTIVIVGVRVRPHDDHIWDPLAKAPGRIVYCSGPSSGKGFEAWASRVRPTSRDLELSECFDDAFEVICSEVRLTG